MVRYPPGNYVKRVEIDRLFGDQDIDIKAPEGSDPRLLVIYGKNGTGKSTVLRIIRSLLSGEDNAGHRSNLVHIPFQRAAVHLEGGVIVEAKKKDGVTGAYDWSVRGGAATEGLHILLKPRNGSIVSDSFDPSQAVKHEKILSSLSDLIKEIVFLDDSRTFMPELDIGELRNLRRISKDGHIYEGTRPGFDVSLDPVTLAIKAVVNSVRHEALLLSNRGNQDAQSIYTNLIRGVAAFQPTQSLSHDTIRTGLADIQQRSAVLAKYGLVTEIAHGEMLSALEIQNPERMGIITAVVGPYIDSFSARFSAIENLHVNLDAWVENLNIFLSPKTVTFRVGDGLNILSRSGEPLLPSMLSSGERHLLMLMTKAFLMRSGGGLMVIDEPEISLNSAWQRNLIPCVLNAFGGGACQLMVASHSLEICSQYQNSLSVI